MNGLELDWEVVDGIVLRALKEQRKMLKKQLKQYKKNPKTDTNPNGIWMHPADVAGDKEIIQAMDKIIHYYGG